MMLIIYSRIILRRYLQVRVQYYRTSGNRIYITVVTFINHVFIKIAVCVIRLPLLTLLLVEPIHKSTPRSAWPLFSRHIHLQAVARAVHSVCSTSFLKWVGIRNKQRSVLCTGATKGDLSAIIWTKFVETIIMFSGGIYLTASNTLNTWFYDCVLYSLFFLECTILKVLSIAGDVAVGEYDA